MDYTEKDLDGFTTRLRAISYQISEVMKLIHGDINQHIPAHQMWEYKFSVFGGPTLHNIFIHQQQCLNLIHGLLMCVAEDRENING